MSTATALSLAGAWFFVALFLFTGALKVARPTRAASAIMHYGFSSQPRKILGVTLGIVEVALAAGIAAASSRFLSLAAAGVLLSIFTLVLWRAVRAGSRFPCGCFGPTEKPLSWWAVTRAGALALLASLLAIETYAAPFHQGAFGDGSEFAAAIAGAGAFAIAALLVVIPSLVLSNRQPLTVRFER